MRRFAFFGLMCLGGLFAFLGAACAEKRVALVIGNSAYKHTNELANPKNDASDIAAALMALGFEVVDGLDLGKAAMDRKVRDFAAVLSGAGAAVFFYAGHGLQVGGVNYLVPVDAQLTTAAGLDFEMLRLDLVQRTMEREAKTNILFLDACRDNPLARNLARAMGTRSGDIGRGLAAAESGVGTLISFSTQPGNVAIDGTGRNSPFAEALVKHITASTDPLGDLLVAVRNDVMAATEKKQVPWEHSALTGRFYFKAPAPEAAALPPFAPSFGRNEAAEAWAATKDTANPAVLEAFVKRFGDSFYGDMAQARLEELKKQQAAVAAPPPKVKPPVGTPVEPAVGVFPAVPNPGETFRDCPECPEMVVVPAGEFMMGSPATEEGRSGDEGPQRKVTIAKPFAAGKYELTFAEWDACVAAGGCSRKPGDNGWGRDKRPVINVSWDDATKEYIPWLTKKSGKTYRLLTEAEWEYVARGGPGAEDDGRLRYWWGNDASHEYANYGKDECCDGLAQGKDQWVNTSPVGQFQGNPFGLHDLHGNVWEWVEDCWNDSYNGAPTDGSAWTSGDCSRRVLRGGSWGSGPVNLRSAIRNLYITVDRGNGLGFRVGRTLTP